LKREKGRRSERKKVEGRRSETLLFEEREIRKQPVQLIQMKKQYANQV
jgi:hypothetical protein